MTSTKVAICSLSPRIRREAIHLPQVKSNHRCVSAMLCASSPPCDGSRGFVSLHGHRQSHTMSHHSTRGSLPWSVASMQLAPLLCARLPPRPWDRPQRNSVLHLLPPSLRRAAGPLSVPDLPVGPPRQSSCVACLPLHRRQSSARKLGAWSVPAAHSLQQTEEISPQASATARVDGHDRSNISQANGRAIPSAAAYPQLTTPSLPRDGRQPGHQYRQLASTPLVDEAWDLLQASVVHYCQQPVRKKRAGWSLNSIWERN